MTNVDASGLSDDMSIQQRFVSDLFDVPTWTSDTFVPVRLFHDAIVGATSVAHVVARCGYQIDDTAIGECRPLCDTVTEHLDLEVLPDRVRADNWRPTVRRVIPNVPARIPVRGSMVTRHQVVVAARDAASRGDVLKALGVSRGDPGAYRRLAAAAAAHRVWLPLCEGAPVSSALADADVFRQCVAQACSLGELTELLGMKASGKTSKRIRARATELDIDLRFDWVTSMQHSMPGAIAAPSPRPLETLRRGSRPAPCAPRPATGTVTAMDVQPTEAWACPCCHETREPRDVHPTGICWICFGHANPECATCVEAGMVPFHHFYDGTVLHRLADVVVGEEPWIAVCGHTVAFDDVGAAIAVHFERCSQCDWPQGPLT